jgi:putative ABC transport system permease protein
MNFLTFILKNLTRRPVRTVLTVLGLSVAVGSMIALLGISDNVERAVNEAFDRRGVDLVVIAGGVTDQLSSDLDQGIGDKIRAMPEVAMVDMAIVELVEVPRGKSNISVMMLGWPPTNKGYEDYKILAGRRLAVGDDRKAMLGATVAQNLGKSVGDTVELQGEPFEVAGVYESFSVFENGSITVLLSEAQRLAARPGRVTGFSVAVKKTTTDPAAEVEAVRQKIQALTDTAGKPVRLSAQPTQDYVESASHIRLTRAMVWMVSVIAIVIGVISMLNTMVMSVLERTQEIGILRAVGWPRGRVVRMVLGESVALGVAAAVAGTVGAALITHALAQFPPVNGFIEGGIAPVVVVQGVAIAALIGLVGGAYPAIRAARLLPTEAIRHD